MQKNKRLLTVGPCSTRLLEVLSNGAYVAMLYQNKITITHDKISFEIVEYNKKYAKACRLEMELGKNDFLNEFDGFILAIGDDADISVLHDTKSELLHLYVRRPLPVAILYIKNDKKVELSFEDKNAALQAKCIKQSLALRVGFFDDDWGLKMQQVLTWFKSKKK
jgi:hypothetical protein